MKLKTKISSRFLALMLCMVFVLSCVSIDSRVYANDIDEYLILEVIAPDETLDKDRIEIAVQLTVPEDTQVYGLHTKIEFDSHKFTYQTSSVKPGNSFSNENLGTEQTDQIPFTFYTDYEPLPAGNYTLFTVELDIKDKEIEGEYGFSISTEEAYTVIFGDTGIEMPDLECYDSDAVVYVGERFWVAPTSVELYIGDIVSIYANKKITEVENMYDNVIAYQNGVVTALAEGKGILFITAETGETEVITIQVKPKPAEPEPEPEPKPDPVPQVKKGDVNGDGKITATDYVNVKFHVLKKQTLSGNAAKAADVNGDGKITATDYVNIKFHVLGKITIK